MNKRNERYDAIRNIIRTKQVRTQKQLVDELTKVGFDCTQATISRDVNEMNLRKYADGGYALAEDIHLHRMVVDLTTTVAVANNLVVIKTAAGTAQGVAAALDGANLEATLGTIAGDDTILVICTSDTSAQTLETLLKKLKRGRSLR